MVVWLLLALAIGFVWCEQPDSKPRQLWDIKVDSLSDIFRDKADHKVFVGKLRE